MEIKSTAFETELINDKHNFYKGNISIPIIISNVNQDAKSLVIFLEDVTGGFNCLHWGIIDVPINTNEILEGASLNDKMPVNSKEITNDFYNKGYTGMFPPKDEVHEYKLTSFSINVETLDTSKLISPYYKNFKQNYSNNIIEEFSIVGFYKGI